MELVTFKKSENFKEKADELFESKKQEFLARLPFADIQHVGGTAIPKLLTKGDMDINIRIPAENFAETVKYLKGVYSVNQQDNWTDTFASFKDDDSYNLPLGIQLTVVDSQEDYFVKHRQALLNDTDLVKRFNEIKISFEGKDMNAYRKAKSKFLEENISISDKQQVLTSSSNRSTYRSS